jgi:hypothetical protein
MFFRSRAEFNRLETKTRKTADINKIDPWMPAEVLPLFDRLASILSGERFDPVVIEPATGNYLVTDIGISLSVLVGDCSDADYSYSHQF